MGRALIARALAHKKALEPKQIQQLKLERPLEVAGVGNGSQRCEYQLLCPIALTDDHDDTQSHMLEAPVIEGVENSTLNNTGLLGLRTLEGKRAILDCGKRMLHLPGDGDVEIILPPGSVSYPLEKVPSGHLALVIDNYEKLKAKAGGIPETSMNLHSNIPESSTECGCGDRYCGLCGTNFSSSSNTE